MAGQGERTRAKLLDAGARVLAERGYRAARVDDVVRVAETSRGTFYLYFRDKDDLVGALAHAAADDMAALAGELGPVGPGPDGLAELRRFLGRFLEVYERHGPVIRAWAENQVDDREVVRLGLERFDAIASTLRPDDPLAATILLGTLERLVYFLTSRPLDLPAEPLLDEAAGMLHRAFFA